MLSTLFDSIKNQMNKFKCIIPTVPYKKVECWLFEEIDLLNEPH